MYEDLQNYGSWVVLLPKARRIGGVPYLPGDVISTLLLQGP